MRVPQFLEDAMKKERVQRFANQKIYRAMESWYDRNGSDEEKAEAEKVLARHGINNPVIEDTRYYGLFIYGKNKRVKIDPIRFDKRVGLTDQQKEVISKRTSHYFYPTKVKYLDYNCNYFKEVIKNLREEWIKEHKPIVDNAIAQIETKEISPGNDYKLMCGISSVGAANARAQMANVMANLEAERKRFGLKTSMYAQFFHLMTSRIEAATVAVLNRNGFKKDRFGRNDLYTFKGKEEEEITKLNGYIEYDKLYCIWNFIKHNSLLAYNRLNDKYPALIVNHNKYQQGSLAIYYVDINEELILNILDGVGRFFDSYCQFVFNEDTKSAWWNYEQYFIKKVDDTIEDYRNPLEWDIFDDID